MSICPASILAGTAFLLSLMARTDDPCVLHIPRYSGDHWVQESEAKCKELLANQKQGEELDSDVWHASFGNE